MTSVVVVESVASVVAESLTAASITVDSSIVSESVIVGVVGPQGIQGVQGDAGDVGPEGTQGIQGDPGPATLETFDTDDLAEGATNQYSQWVEEVAPNSELYLKPSAAASLLVGNALGLAALSAAFVGAQALFIDRTDGGTSFFANGGTGLSFLALGGVYASTRARGIAGTEEAAQPGDTLGAWIASPYNGTQYSLNFNGQLLPGLFTRLVSDPAGDDFDVDFTFGGLTTDIATFGLRSGGAHEIGFHGKTPVAQDAGHTITNLTELRTLDLEDMTLSEMGRVLGTLIEYLTARGDLA